MNTPKRQKARFQLHLAVFIILILTSGTLLALSTGGFIISFKQVGFSLVSSVQKGVNGVYIAVVSVFKSVKDLADLKQEYNRLTEMLKDYEYLQRSNADIRSENERLREQLGFSRILDYQNYPAYVIARDPNNLYSAITINKGSRHGIKKNMPVIAVQSGTVGLVGKVINVGFDASMVMPVYDYQCSVSARIRHTRDIGLVSGAGSPDVPLIMKYIKKRVIDDLHYGDKVVTSGENDNYLRDIQIGTITQIRVIDYDSSLEISITPAVDFSRLESVICIDMKNMQEEK